MTHQEGGQERLPVRREAFAPGTIGEMDFQLILAGVVCESFISEKERCGKLAIKILDFDTATSTEQLPVCGDACESAARQRIIGDGAKRGKSPTMGVNGWGRH
jgi:hypothetical protein